MDLCTQDSHPEARCYPVSPEEPDEVFAIPRLDAQALCLTSKLFSHGVYVHPMDKTWGGLGP